jgi:tetratricopeptide (TPR) repeat protein
MEQQVMSGMAEVAEIHADWYAAEACLRDLLKLSPEDLLAHQRLARALFWQTRQRDAYNVLKAAKRLDREHAKRTGTQEAFLTPEAIMAKWFDEFEGPNSTSGNPKKWFDAALRMAPDDLPTRQVAALWALENGNLPYARQQAEAALRIATANPTIRDGSNVANALCGMVALWEKKWLEAEHYFEKILLENPNDFIAKNNLALALVEQDASVKKQRALAYAEGNFRIDGNNPEVLSTLGWVYFRRGEFDRAKAALTEAIKASPGGATADADTITYFAHVLYHGDQKWQAKELLEAILNGKRAFSMRPEAQKLYERVKDTKQPEAAGAAK